MLTPSQLTTRAADPLVTMIMLSYNHSRFVPETLESIKAQTYKNTELIIIDDCSSDDSAAVIDRWLSENKIRCTFIRHQKNQGICKSLNEALAHAGGKYVSMIASDDIWLPDKIERQVAIMESQPETVGIVYSDAFEIDEDGRCEPGLFIATHWKLLELPQGQLLDMLMRGNCVLGQTALIRRSCYDKVGLYDENLPWEDWDMWMRIARHYSFLSSPTPWAKYRIHKHSFSHAQPERIAKQSIKVGLKQFAVGGLTEEQKSTLTGTLLKWATQLYSGNDTETAAVLQSIWRATGDKRAGWMYRSASLGLPFRNWQRACGLRVKLLGVLHVMTGRNSP